MPSERLHFSNSRELSQLYVNDPSNLLKLGAHFCVTIASRDNWVQIDGSTENVHKAKLAFDLLESARQQGIEIGNADFSLTLRSIDEQSADALRSLYSEPTIVQIKNKRIIAKTLNQKRFLQAIDHNSITFGIGPAGTGKTFLAMATALKALIDKKVDRIVLTRPAVEAGEALGFLPGELQEKILPYLIPLYDAMHCMLGKDSTDRLIEKGVIEIAPLAYMRGRTLSNAFIILDEAQNTTREQMMLFLTRLGDRSRMVITGDLSQTDLPRNKPSGLQHASQILKQVDALQLFYFQSRDVIRHPLVQKIIDAYTQDSE
jgi:phosphate starvation-inducible PhoH-like protein